ncbi:hypothetical protein OUZ56_030376 [Daphnia magna]|uniref:Uncharacterized protein n=1 Tax=Daphnia magna TaxID=35525 RepID=A0ABQ9ZR41_9CRUS|nr:hypothetical protein OUZ56_030376 [Daphnia magna]
MNGTLNNRCYHQSSTCRWFHDMSLNPLKALAIITFLNAIHFHDEMLRRASRSYNRKRTASARALDTGRRSTGMPQCPNRAIQSITAQQLWMPCILLRGVKHSPFMINAKIDIMLLLMNDRHSNELFMN